MSEITFGIHPRQVGNRNALRRICDTIEREVDPETLPETVKASATVLREIACGYGYGGAVDESVLDHNINQLENANAQPKPELSSDEQDAALRVCHAVEGAIEPDAAKVHDLTFGGERESPLNTLMLKSWGIDCSVEALRKTACSLGFENKKIDVSDELNCLSRFTENVRVNAYRMKKKS